MELIEFDKYVNTYNYNKIASCIGEFDGVHLAHQALIDKTISYAKANNLHSAIICFEPHPYLIFNPDTSNYLLTDLEEKSIFINNLCVDYLIVIKFNKEVSNLSPKVFINDYLNKLNIQKLFMGYDFSFGKDALGTKEDITNNSNIQVEVLDKIYYNESKLSSSLIRKFLVNGDILKANSCLGRPFMLKGNVIHGFGIGKSLGFPTANLDIDKVFVLPKEGVYAVDCIIEGIKYRGILNIGFNPTFNRDSKTVEVFIINLNKNIYDKTVFIEFLSYLRDEVKFDSEYELIEQLKIDSKNALCL